MNEDQNKFSEEVKPLLKEVRESLPFIQKIIIAPVALGIALGGKYLSEVQRRQAEAKKEANIRSQKQRADERARMIEERNATESAKIAAEKRAEDRERKIREEEKKLTPRKIIHTSLSAISTIALVIGVSMLAPIAKWTYNVNECVKELALSDERNLSFGERVIKCNKGR